MLFGTKDGTTWHVVKETFPLPQAEERAAVWLCGKVEQGSESLDAMLLGPRPLGDVCPGCEQLVVLG